MLDLKFSTMWSKSIKIHVLLEDAYEASGCKVLWPIDMVMDDHHLVISVLVEKENPTSAQSNQSKLMIFGKYIAPVCHSKERTCGA